MSARSILETLILALGFVLVVTLPLAAETMRLQTFTSTVPDTPADIAAEFEGVSEDLTISDQDGTLYIAYSGLETPDKLSRFLLDAFPDVPAEPFQKGHAANLSLALVPQDSGTEMRLMMFLPPLPDAEPVEGLPNGAGILINDGYDNACSGQVVYSYDQPEATALTTFTAWLSEDGFDVQNASDDTTSFFIGNKPGCSVFAYIQPDPDIETHSMVVIRYLED